MGIIEKGPAIADVIGVPQFFITEALLEHVGDGNVRVAGCILQNGVYVPQYYAVMSYRTIIRCGSKAVITAQSIQAHMESLLSHSQH